MKVPEELPFPPTSVEDARVETQSATRAEESRRDSSRPRLFVVIYIRARQEL